MAELPVTDPTMIAGLQADWEKEMQRGSHEATQAAFRRGSQHVRAWREVDALSPYDLLIIVPALHRLVWGLVHSPNNKDVDRGLTFADELLRDKSLDAQDQRDLVYLTAVAMYKLGKVCSIALQQLVLA